MTKALIATIALSIFGHLRTYAQPLAIDRYYEGGGRFTPIVDIRLFDLEEIARRRIDTAYIIRHPAGWDPGFNDAYTYDDTLELYCFDLKGRIIQRSYFQSRGRYYTSFYYDSLGNVFLSKGDREKSTSPGRLLLLTEPADTTKSKTVISIENRGTNTIQTELNFWLFKNRLDTAYVVLTTKDEIGRIIEISSSVNSKHKQEVDDDTGEMTYHYKYHYDQNGRLIYFLSYDDSNRPSTSKTISYPNFGQVIETRDAITNRLFNTEVLLKSTSKGVITISNETSQTTLTPVEEGSKLYKLKTIATSGSFPYLEYYEISYR